MTERVFVKSVEIAEMADGIPVFDIQVEIDHCFIAEGIVVHNCETCIALSGQVWDLEGNMIGETTQDFPGPPPEHINCFPGDTLVASNSPITDKSQRWYDGEMIVVDTAAGHHFSCTPNHPILTRHGWVAAHLLQEGHYVIRSLHTQWKRSRSPDDHDMPTRIENVAVPALSSFGVRTAEVPTTAIDFHGDVSGSHVAVITTNRQLRRQQQSAFTQHRTQGLFDRGGVDLKCALPGLCSLHHPVFARRSTTDGFIGGTSHRFPLFRRHVGLSYKHRFATRSHMIAGFLQSVCQDASTHAVGTFQDWQPIASLIAPRNLFNRDGEFNAMTPRSYASSMQSSPDRGEADAELARQILSSQTGPIATDKIVRIQRRIFCGHVYNLQTMSGFYVANGIIAHNCRCGLVPVLKSWEQMADDAGGNKTLAKKMDRLEEQFGSGTQSSLDGQVSADLDYETWLEGRSVEDQKEVLGPGRYRLWQEGKIGLTDLIDQRGNPRTIAQLKRVS